MKIAMLGQKRIPSREGGVEIVVEELSSRMAEKGNEVTCYNRSGRHVSNKKIKNSKLKSFKGVKLKKVVTIDKKGLAAMTSSFFASVMILFSKSDIVHYHAEGPCAMLWIIKLFSRKKIVVTIHGLDWQRAKWGKFASKYIKFGEKMAVKYADEIIVLSHNIQEYFKKTYNRETVYIPNGVSKPKMEEANIIHKKYNLNKDDYILYLGRIVPEKGIHYLIEAFNSIETDKKLVIAGGSSDTDSYFSELRELSKNNERIIFTGFVEGKELAELYSNAYIYCLPSDVEGMPLSLLEAMSYQNCCLTSDIRECSEVIENAGVTFKASNVKDLIKKLKYLLNNEKKVGEYKNQAQNYILNKYNWDSVTEETLTLYRKGSNVQSVNTLQKHWTNIINIILYFIYILIYSLLVVFFGLGNSVANWRYYILAGVVLLSFISIFIKYGKKVYKKKLFCKELLFTIFTAIVFLIFSLICSKNTGIPLHYRTLVQISLFLLPSLYAFNFINIFSMKTIFNIMKFTTLVIIVMYFLQPGHCLSDFFNLANWRAISFTGSVSFTESSEFAEVFLQLFVFFYYFKTKPIEKKQRRSLHIFSIVTLIFTILSFKRLGILFAIFIFIFGKIVKRNQNLSFNPTVLLAIVFTILTIGYTKFMQGLIFTNIDVSKLTSWRNWILSLWETKGYLSYGYGSSMLVIGRYLEMDLVQIYLELNVIALLLFCFTFFRIAKRNGYSQLVMIYAFLNMLTASSLPWTLGWVIMMIAVSCIASDKYETEEIFENNNKMRRIEKA